jgi:cytochrome c biogenesis protein CcdA
MNEKRVEFNPNQVNNGRQSFRWIVIAISLIFVITALVLLVINRGKIEAGVANFALLLPVGYAFGAGMVASANPCGVLLLPSYALFQIGTEQEQSSIFKRLLRSILIAAVLTLGFVLIFGLVGVVISAGGQWLVEVFPIIGLVIGLAMAGGGIYLLVTHKSLGIFALSRLHVERQRGLGNAFVFGIVYALGSLSCTLPVFLVVVGSALSGGNFISSMGQFISYALGMGLIIVIVMIGTALFRETLSRGLRKVVPHIHRVSSLFMIGAGGYLVYYWLFLGS